MNLLEAFQAVISTIDKYFPSPYKEIFIGIFCLILLLGLLYGTLRGFGRAHSNRIAETNEPESERDEGEVATSPRTGNLGAKLSRAEKKIKQLEANAEVDFGERYYLYFNGIANASLMLAFAVLFDRYYSVPAAFSAVLRLEIGKLLSLMLAGLLVSIIFIVLFDRFAREERRTNLINRAFLISFVTNLVIFIAYHFRYISP